MQTNQQQQLKVQAYVMQEREVSDDITVSGTLLPSEETDIHPEVSGRVVTLSIAEGSVVPKGALLCKIFDGDLQAQRKKLEAQLAIAQNTEQRQKELLAINGSSKQDYELATLQVNNINADIELINVQIAKTEIRAPFTGKIGLKKISPGAYITPATSIVTLQQTSPLKLDFNVPEKYGKTLRVGQALTFSVEGMNGMFTAKILATDAGVNESTRNLMVRAIVSGSASGLIPGSFAKVNLELDKNSDALMVPTQSIIPQARDKKIIVIKNGIATFTTVTTGIREKDYVEVFGNVAVGDTIATTGIMFIKPNAKVTVAKVINM
ncbi:MAG: efflux RND transporter periplasmic adaptor subunit [Candidatus Kapabacteria bacterium]|nr:efflux RND transporter periplasmic adaptor subunit [Candidatus Kapabacteria bacterium]